MVMGIYLILLVVQPENKYKKAALLITRQLLNLKEIIVCN